VAGDCAALGCASSWFCASAYGPDEHPPDLVLDLDSTNDPAPATQQRPLFHGWCGQHMYRPRLWFTEVRTPSK
jgi:hypothetical protein